MYCHLVLVYLAIEVESTCENAAKKETKFDMVNMVLESQHTRVLYSLLIADSTTVKEAVAVISYCFISPSDISWETGTGVNLVSRALP